MSKKQNWYTNPRKYHFIYKTSCQVNGKYYYGMHSTDDLNDGYIGSGTRLWHSIRKHGRENFKMEILEFCKSREILKEREAELITEEMLHDPQCMNLRTGGEGGYSFAQEVKTKMKDRWTPERREAQADRLRKITSGRFKNYWLTNKTREEKLQEKRQAEGWTPPDRSQIATSQWKRVRLDPEKFALIKQKMSQKAKDRVHELHTIEAKANMSAAALGKKQRIVRCPHCAKEGGAATMPRWHFENCKQKCLLS